LSIMANDAQLKFKEDSVRKVNNLHYQLYKVILNKKLKVGETIELSVTAIFGHCQIPKPAAITQTQKQLVEYSENTYIYSPYPIESQKTQVLLASSRIEANTEVHPTEIRGNQINFGPYENTEAFHFDPLVIHFENNSPFLTFTSVVKEIEVSHWGNVAVEETYNLEHTGAKLKGGYSRLDYVYGQTGNSVRDFTQYLPKQARDAYYRDDIGNVSTSHVFPSENGIKLDIDPRFVLFGGWKIDFYLGYNLPSENFLSTGEGWYVLDIPLATDSGAILTNELEVRVILPEGATDIQVHTPFDVEHLKTSSRLTYLDYFGRPVVSFRKSNVVSEHNQNFQVTYRAASGHMLQEPLLLIIGYFVLFLTTMVLVRLDFSLVSENKK